MTKQEVKKTVNEMMPVLVDKVKSAIGWENPDERYKTLKTIEDLAKLFDVSKVTIHGWINKHKIKPSWQTPGGKKRYDVNDFNVLKNQQFEKVYNLCN